MNDTKGRSEWWIVAWAREIGNQPLDRFIDDRKLSIARGADGRWYAQHDGTTLPTVERYTAVWVWLGQPTEADVTRVPVFTHLESPGTSREHRVVPLPYSVLFIEPERARTDRYEELVSTSSHSVTLLTPEHENSTHCFYTYNTKPGTCPA